MADETETAVEENEVNEDSYQAGFACYDFLFEVLIRIEEIVDEIQANESDRGNGKRALLDTYKFVRYNCQMVRTVNVYR